MVDNKRRIVRFDFIKDYACDGKTCGSRCCRDVWGIDIDEVTLKKYQNLSSITIREKLQNSIKYDSALKKHILQRDNNGACPFLADDGLCGIQRSFGEEYISDICCTYPRSYLDFGDYITETVGLSCYLASKNFLKLNTPLELVDICEDIKRTNIIKSKKANTIAYTNWIEINNTVMQILQNNKTAIRERLIIVFMLGEGIQDLEVNGGDLHSLLMTFLSPGTQDELLQLFLQVPVMRNNYINDFLELFISLCNDKITKQDREIGQYKTMVTNYYKLDEKNTIKEYCEKYIQAKDVYDLYMKENYPLFEENYLVHEWFSLAMPILAKGSIVDNMIIFLLYFRLQQMILMVLIAEKQDKLKEDDIVNCVSYVTKLVEHSPVFFYICTRYLADKNYSLIDYLKIWLA